MKRDRKGFTIVELVIVIAVIAILASVLVPTFSGIIYKAKKSADIQLIKNINDQNKILTAEKGITKFDTLYDAIIEIKKTGYDLESITLKTNLNFAWNSISGEFVLIDFATSTITYPVDESFGEKVLTNEEKPAYFLFTSYSDDIELSNYLYSIYAIGNDWKETINVYSGFDTGHVSTIEKIIVNNIENKNDMIIHTNYFNTKVEIKNFSDSLVSEKQLKHYGYSYLVDIDNISNNYYKEYGEVARLKINQGVAYIEKGAKVYCAMAESSNANIIVNDGYVSLDKENIKAVEKGIVADKDEFGIARTLIADCELGNHNNKVLICDQSKLYYVCSCCGYSLIPTQTRDINTNPIYHTRLETAQVVDDSLTPKDKCFSGIVNMPNSTEYHEHEFVYQYESTFKHKVSCTICGLSFSDCHEYDDTGVCKICNQKVEISNTKWEITQDSYNATDTTKYLFYYNSNMKVYLNEAQCNKRLAVYQASSTYYGYEGFINKYIEIDNFLYANYNNNKKIYWEYTDEENYVLNSYMSYDDNILECPVSVTAKINSYAASGTITTSDYIKVEKITLDIKEKRGKYIPYKYKQGSTCDDFLLLKYLFSIGTLVE